MNASVITKHTRSLLAVLVLSVASLPATAIDRKTEERLQNIERKLESRGLVDMFNRLEQMQRDLQGLRGELELQTHRIESMERRQREQYMDIDRRLQELELRSTGAVLPPPAGTDSPPGGVATAPPPVVPVAPTAPTAPTAPSTDPGVVSDPAVAQAEYDQALAVLREGRYADAAQSFKEFLGRHPNSTLAANASYWLGETYYVTRDFDASLKTFTGLVTNHPQSPKVADSRLKIGYIHYEKKDWKAARQELEGLVSSFPGTTAARLASDRLARMKKEGR